MTQIVLIVDDDPIQRRLLDAHVARMGLRPLHCDGGRAALDALSGRDAGQIAAVVLDLMMPDKSGMEVMAEMRRNRLDIPIVVQTAKGSIDTVVEAMRAGAFDFVVKPVAPDRLRLTLSNAVRMRSAARPAAGAGSSRGSALGDVRASPSMRSVLAKAAKAALSNIPILIEGETGVGKEWLARAIQAASDRSSKPFVAVNCGALPGELVESILFGHAKGAFTDATQSHEGKFLEADGGTLFLDEVGELAPSAQVKLLRVLQEGEIDPVGGRTPVKTDARVISATNRDLAAAVAAGRFREDLYYRLNAFDLTVPPLRERREEIRRLAECFLDRWIRVEKQTPVRRLGEGALDLIERYDWPGNIRQLENVIHRAVVLGESELLDVADFPQILALIEAGGERVGPNAVAAPSPAVERQIHEPHQDDGRTEGGEGGRVPLRDENGQIRRIVDIEADLIRLAVTQYNGRMSEIARRLGIGRSTLYRKMREYKIGDD
ncbi:sigma-54 dependent transcriptional regulator [Aurantimonas sp. VKM B-3413]|uniref:sigma-54-dependent transcriptional regulator n=1 Tax=Aurantimonas sp. VKM B-3413 TaxID=2779401 RepID=UPI001E2A44AB|nr:sigma-54 dependent transcriptional regulator [Aurantimonas sp. VKM B-3413]MCB8839562.1 sigma-54 dependent transcriptional regulator [Aurantimonas sp. VKM B-3413]